MVTIRASSAAVFLAAALLSPLQAAPEAPTDYKLGDLAREDIITPVPLLVVNPAATEALKQKVAQQVQFIIRIRPQGAADAEKELRDNIAAARSKFMSALQRALGGRAPTEADLATPALTDAIRDTARDFPKDLPFDRLASYWVRGASEDFFVEGLLQPLREVMAQPIVNGDAENPVPTNLNVWLLPVKSLTDQPTLQEMDSAGTSVPPEKIISFWRARRLVETHFPPGQEALGRYVAGFVRANTYLDPALTEIVRARRTEGVTLNDTYSPAEVIVRKGQVIDRKALSALAALREKSLIGTLQVKLEQEQTLAGQITRQTKWLATALGVMVAILVLIFWRLRVWSARMIPPPPMLDDPALGGAAQQALPPGSAGDAMWRRRALQAEAKAERAQQAIRSGVLGWMREKVFRSLFSQRAELLSAQQKAEAEMRELEQRLEQLRTPLQERIAAYEKRIEGLEKELALKGEENRELIGARISVAKQQLTVERERERGWFATS